MIITGITSLVIGTLAGIFFGLAFLFQGKRVFLLNHQKIFIFVLTLMRFIALGFFLCYILPYPYINPILFLIAFLAAWWYIIFTKGL